jgi:colanic acid/amylovoran biosynthesis glycosyltransferase
MCGRLVWKKGFEFGIEAFALASKKHPELRMRIVGSGPLKQALINKAESLKALNDIEFAGELLPDKIPSEMANADILLVPSIEEGIPNVIKEALACGIPVISTYAGGIPEIIRAGVSGLLVEVKNSEAIAQKINYLAENPQIWQPLAEAGRAAVEEDFDVKIQMSKLESLYKGMIERWKKQQ